MGMMFDCIRRWDVFFADLGIPNGSKLGHRRPVLIMEDEQYTRNCPTVLAAVITGASRIERLPSRVNLMINPSGRELIILFDQLCVIDKSSLVRYLGHIYGGEQEFLNAMTYILRRNTEALHNEE